MHGRLYRNAHDFNVTPFCNSKIAKKSTHLMQLVRTWLLKSFNEKPLFALCIEKYSKHFYLLCINLPISE